MAVSDDPNRYSVRPVNTEQTDVQVTSTEVYVPKSAEEANSIARTHGAVKNRRSATVFGLAIVAVITVAALATFLGFTHSSAPSAHEDAVRLLFLVLGAVLGALFQAKIDQTE